MFISDWVEALQELMNSTFSWRMTVSPLQQAQLSVRLWILEGGNYWLFFFFFSMIFHHWCQRVLCIWYQWTDTRNSCHLLVSKMNLIHSIAGDAVGPLLFGVIKSALASNILFSHNFLGWMGNVHWLSSSSIKPKIRGHYNSFRAKIYPNNKVLYCFDFIRKYFFMQFGNRPSATACRSQWLWPSTVREQQQKPCRSTSDCSLDFMAKLHKDQLILLLPLCLESTFIRHLQWWGGVGWDEIWEEPGWHLSTICLQLLQRELLQRWGLSARAAVGQWQVAVPLMNEFCPQTKGHATLWQERTVKMRGLLSLGM